MPEIVNPLPKGAIQPRSLCSFDSAKEMFDFASAHVVRYRLKEYLAATQRMNDTSRFQVSQLQFLEDYVWCVYVSGFSAKIISDKFKDLLHFHHIKGYFGEIPCNENTMLSQEQMEAIYSVFKNKSKANAVQKVRRKIATLGWKNFHEVYVKDRDPVKLQGLPNIGPALSCHLARNLGNLNVCKPDVHLKRIADKYGFESVQKMCETLNPDIPAGYVDLLLWLACIDHGTKTS